MEYLELDSPRKVRIIEDFATSTVSLPKKDQDLQFGLIANEGNGD